MRDIGNKGAGISSKKTGDSRQAIFTAFISIE